MNKLKEKLNQPAVYLGLSALLFVLIRGWLGLVHLSRQDVLIPLVLFLLVSFSLLCFVVIRLLRDKGPQHKATVYVTGVILIVWIALATDWNPGWQVRKPGPWQEWEIPTDPVELAAYEFAHSIQLPEEPKPDNFYKTGLFGIWGRTTSYEYFKHLCETEAGEFIYKTVEGVEGIYQMRPREQSRSREELQERYPMEDPFGYINMEASAPHALFVHYKGYAYLETTKEPDKSRIKLGLDKFLNTPVSYGKKYWRYTYDKEKKLFLAENIDVLQSRYGFIWRGIRRPYDRENGIAGGELIILDLETNEVLGLRRGFLRTGRVSDNSTGINWEVTRVCENLPLIGSTHKSVDFTFWFVSKVLKPNKGMKLMNGEE